MVEPISAMIATTVRLELLYHLANIRSVLDYDG